MMKFYLPFVYTFSTRLINRSQKIAWFFTYLFPVGLLFFLISNVDVTIINYKFFLVFVIGVTTIYTIYEIGYIQNDTETIKIEYCPTLRLPEEDMLYYEESKIKIYIIRIICIIFFLIILYLFDIKIQKFGIILIILLLSFFLHNLYRSRINLLTQFFLSSIRYLSIGLLFIDVKVITDYCIFLLIFPVINIIEWFTKERFNLPFFIDMRSKIDIMRVYYYSITIVIVLFYFSHNIFYKEVLIILFYFLSYRISTFLIAQKLICREMVIK